MPRPRRNAAPGCTFHVVNRGNDKRQLFFEDADYERFIGLLEQGKQLRPVKLFGVCVMSNHFHAVLQPTADNALSAYVQWVTSCYACDLRTKTQTRGHGHIFQRRFWSRPIVDELHFLTVLRYVEANPLRARLVTRAEDWKWSSLHLRTACATLVDAPPNPLPPEWSTLVNRPLTTAELQEARACEIKRGRPRRVSEKGV